MKITNVEALYLRLPRIEARTDSSQDALIVKVTTDAGMTGWGEVDSCPLVAKAIIEAPMSHTLVSGLRNLVVGEDPLEIERLWHKMYQSTLYYGRNGAVIHAMAGIDLALWDIKGKALGQPVWRLLGGGYRDKLRFYASNMFQFTAQATADRAKAAVDKGYTAVKFGWEPFGRGTLAEDLRYLEALRKAVGDNVDIMLDVGLVWDAKTTIQRARAFEPFNLFWIEEPLHPDDLEGYAKVSASVDQRIAAGEEECTVEGFRRLMDEGQIDVVQVDLTRCGLTQAMRIAALAQQRGLTVINHNFTTDINTAASLHFLSSVPNAFILEYCVEPSEISRSLARNPIKVVDGHAAVPTEPGLGVEPDPAIIEKYLVRD
ncbi:MAG: mandelate racemase/muconate lactonizing enzyme family protein [Rhodospirillaceae bacterium]|nr:mandelate racemase/muconate lactonizing enzyme family protein [Rhodospirillaceae bacterium]